MRIDQDQTTHSAPPASHVAARIVGAAGKGGGGKSTLLMSTAVYLANEWDVAIVDADLDNRSIVHWGQVRSKDPSLTPIRIETPRTGERTVDALNRAMHDGVIPNRQRLVLVDCPGGPRRHLPDDLYNRLEIVYLPVEPSTTAVAATARLLADFRALGVAGPTVRIIVNRWTANRRRLDAHEAFAKLNVPVARAIRSYVLHVDATAAGGGVTEFDPEHKAADDIRSLGDDIESALHARDKVGLGAGLQPITKRETRP